VQQETRLHLLALLEQRATQVQSLPLEEMVALMWVVRQHTPEYPLCESGHRCRCR
jgi:hypothetical protein